MAVTYSATPMGAYRSALRNSLISIQAGNIETLTLVHRIGACPTEIRMMLRSTIQSDSGIPLQPPQIVTMNASQAVMAFGDAATAMGAQTRVDIICEVTHSIVS